MREMDKTKHHPAGFPVRIYVSDINAEDTFYEKWYDRMPSDRRKQADRFKFEDDRKRCIRSYALLYEAMRDLADDGIIACFDEMPLIEKTASGKPFFCDLPVGFSISHSYDRVMVALAPSDVGCDVEKIRDNDPAKIADRFFAKEESALICGLDDDLRDEEFTSVWTLKESVIKCTGEGMQRPLADFSVISPDGCKKDTVVLDGKIFYMRHFPAECGYCYGVCSAYEDFEVDIRKR